MVTRRQALLRIIQDRDDGEDVDADTSRNPEPRNPTPGTARPT
jgi:hypothetical protein